MSTPHTIPYYQGAVGESHLGAQELGGNYTGAVYDGDLVARVTHAIWEGSSNILGTSELVVRVDNMVHGMAAEIVATSTLLVVGTVSHAVLEGTAPISGSSESLVSGIVATPINIENLDILGSSEVILDVRNHISAMLQLSPLLLAPGEQIIIDTDLYTVLVDGTHDILSLTADSELFQLSPGENTLIFTPVFGGAVSEWVRDNVAPLNVKLIWQDRWL